MKNKNVPLSQIASTFTGIRSIPANLDASKQQADITNAPELFGDPFDDDDDDDGDGDFGDVDYGDVDYGDTDDAYGDPDVLSMYTAISGDPNPSKRKVKNMIAGAALGVGAAYGVSKLAKVIQRKKKAKAILRRQPVNSVTRAIAMRRSVPGLRPMSYGKFFNVSGGILNNSPLPPGETFVIDTLKLMLDQQQIDGQPFYNEVVNGTPIVGGFNVVTTWAGPADRRYCAFILKIGSAALTVSPGTVITISGSFPTSGGVITLTQPIIITYKSGAYVNLLVFPWNLVTTKPYINNGVYGPTAGQINLNITGIPSQSAVTLIIPGSLDNWTSELRNSIAKGISFPK